MSLKGTVMSFAVVGLTTISLSTYYCWYAKKLKEKAKEQETKESRNLLNLLYNIAEDQARREGNVHRGITCNCCSVSPVRGIRYKCANCVDYDLCATCEAQVRHTRTHAFLKIRIPIPPLANPRSALLPNFYPGCKQEVKENLTWDTLRALQKKANFDQVELEALFEQYKSLASENGIDKDTFEQCLGPLGVEKNLVTERLFKFFDRDSDGYISFKELVCGLSVLCKGTFDEKIEHAFKGYDLNDNGYITTDELYRMFKAYFYLSMELVRDVIRNLEEEMDQQTSDESSNSAFVLGVQSNPTEEKDIFMPRSNMRRRSSATAQSDRGDMWPILEVMSQDAIEELVDSAFANADIDKDGKINFEEFKALVHKDSQMIAWFEALGSVF